MTIIYKATLIGCFFIGGNLLFAKFLLDTLNLTAEQAFYLITITGFILMWITIKELLSGDMEVFPSLILIVAIIIFWICAIQKDTLARIYIPVIEDITNTLITM